MWEEIEAIFNYFELKLAECLGRKSKSKSMSTLPIKPLETNWQRLEERLIHFATLYSALKLNDLDAFDSRIKKLPSVSRLRTDNRYKEIITAFHQKIRLMPKDSLHIPLEMLEEALQRAGQTPIMPHLILLKSVLVANEADVLRYVLPILRAGARVLSPPTKTGFLGARTLEASFEALFSELMDLGFNPNYLDEQKQTVLFRAILNQKTAVAQTLIHHPRVYLNLVDKDGYAVLHYAVMLNQIELVESLLNECLHPRPHRFGAMHYIDLHGLTPLRGKSLFRRTRQTALQIAKEEQFVEIIQLFKNYHTKPVSNKVEDCANTMHSEPVIDLPPEKNTFEEEAYLIYDMPSSKNESNDNPLYPPLDTSCPYLVESLFPPVNEAQSVPGYEPLHMPSFAMQCPPVYQPSQRIAFATNEIVSYLTGKAFEEDNDLQAACAHYSIAIQSDYYLAFQALERLAFAGISEAQYALALNYYHRKNDRTSAIGWCLLAAEQEHVNAQTYLLETPFYAEQYLLIAKKYDQGMGVRKNTPSAILFYEKAYVFNNKEAAFRLGQLYQLTPQGVKKAFHCYMKAATLGHYEALSPLERLAEDLSARKQHALSQLYCSFFPNQEKATFWHNKALEVEQFTFN
ncbi:MAG: ankyrin repeat domain-containing protein [Tatlockia sp.]|jgi:ankyrin repeat protein